jgi:hypothetical protein
VLSNLALALIRQGDLDEAAGQRHQAIDVSRGRGPDDLDGLSPGEIAAIPVLAQRLSR